MKIVNDLKQVGGFRRLLRCYQQIKQFFKLFYGENKLHLDEI
jgi:hypothetical protein